MPPIGECLFLFFFLFELTVDGVEAEIDGFFECVGGFVGEDVLVLWHTYADEGVFVECRFRFDHLKSYVDVGDVGVVTRDAFGFFLDERFEFSAASK